MPRRSLAVRASVLTSLTLLASTASAATLTVGPGKTYATPCAAIAVANPGDTVLVSVGTAAYTDSCAIGVAGLTVRGVGGQPKIDLSGTDHPANYKGIYDVTANDVTLANLELTGANISDANGANGAGIRDEADGLVVTGCYIHDNQDGILATPASTGSTLVVEYTQLFHNGLGDGCTSGGCTHNIYVGSSNMETFIFAFNWSHDVASGNSETGHLLKTRAQNSYILYNQLAGEIGTDSYELDIPQGGLGVVVGNVIQKGAAAENPTLLTYGEEGLLNTTSQLYVGNNTFVSDLASSVTFIKVAAGATLTAHNNLFAGTGTLSSTGALSADNLATSSPMFVAAATFDYHLVAGSPAIGKGVAAGTANGFSLTPTFEYVQPLESVARSAATDLGAFELGTVLTGAGSDAGISVTDAGAPAIPDASVVVTKDGGVQGHDSGMPMGEPDGSSSTGQPDAGSSHSSDAASHTDASKSRPADAASKDSGGSATTGDGSSASTPGSGGGCTLAATSDPSDAVWLGFGLVGTVFLRRRRARASV